MAAAVRVLGPQIAGLILAREIRGGRFERARVGEAEAVDQDVAVGEGLEEVLAGFEEQHRGCLVDLGH
jgi:hypothetical protein